MALVLFDRVKETSNTAGTGTIVLANVAVTGFQLFSAVVANNSTTYYTIADQTGNNWEVGLGTYYLNNVSLARTTVLSSSNAGALTNFTNVTHDVFITYPAEKSVNQDASGTVTAFQLAANSVTSTTPVLSFNASNCDLALGANVSSTYLQAVMQNKSSTAGASTNWAVSNDLGTDSTYYGEFGMNSSQFSASTPSDYFSINNGTYFSAHDGDISVGSGNGYKTYFPWGTLGQSAHVINASGALGLSTTLGTTPALSGLTGYGTAGQYLTSQGNAAAPTWSTASGALAAGNSAIVINNVNVTSNANIAAGTNGFSVGPITTANGVSVTIASGQRWVVI
jgi:hypothetical protein